MGAGSLQKEEGGDEIIGWLGVACDIKVNQAMLAIIMKTITPGRIHTE